MKIVQMRKEEILFRRRYHHWHRHQHAMLRTIPLLLSLLLCCYHIPIPHTDASPFSSSVLSFNSRRRSSSSTFFNDILVNPINVGVRSAIASNKSILTKEQGERHRNRRQQQRRGDSSTCNTCTTLACKSTRGRGRQDQPDFTYNDFGHGYDEENNDTLLTSRNVISSKSHEFQTELTSTTTVRTKTASTSVSANINTNINTCTNANTNANTSTRGGGSSKSKITPQTVNLYFWENMLCGAVSRSVAQTATHPANTMKTLLQSNRSAEAGGRMTLKQIAKFENLKMLKRGAGAQFILSIPHGAVNFAVLEYVRRRINTMAMNSAWASQKKENSAAFGPAMDFVSSAIATVCCSVVSTPQMMIVDNIMAGTYPNLARAVGGLSAEKGVAGFYTGWWPGLAGKIPSYALTWTLFQQLKQLQLKICQRDPKDFENSIMGCIASATTVCIMIPMDTIKTRLVTQMNYPDLVPYKGIIDAAVRISKEEGIGTFYRGLPPRLISVVPMIGIQFGVYESMKKVMLSRHQDHVIMAKNKMNSNNNSRGKNSGENRTIESVIMEVAADDDQPFPAPSLGNYRKSSKRGKKEKVLGRN